MKQKDGQQNKDKSKMSGGLGAKAERMQIVNPKQKGKAPAQRQREEEVFDDGIYFEKEIGKGFFLYTTYTLLTQYLQYQHVMTKACPTLNMYVDTSIYA